MIVIRNASASKRFHFIHINGLSIGQLHESGNGTIVQAGTRDWRAQHNRSALAGKITRPPPIVQKQ
jgi:hypothetical protein